LEEEEKKMNNLQIEMASREKKRLKRTKRTTILSKPICEYLEKELPIDIARIASRHER
jgi:hypothetical protein